MFDDVHDESAISLGENQPAQGMEAGRIINYANYIFVFYLKGKY